MRGDIILTGNLGAKREKNNGAWGRAELNQQTQAKIKSVLAIGLSVRKIAEELPLSTGTVQKYKA